MKKSEVLYEAIGEIDDRYIAEAGRPFRKRNSTLAFTRMALAAALVLAVVLSSIAFFASVRSLLLPKNSGNSYGIDDAVGGTTRTDRTGDLQSDSPPTGESFPDAKLIGYVPEEDIDFFGSDALVIIRRDGEDDLTVIKVSADTLKKLENSVGDKAVDNTQSEIGVSVWLCDGQGSVISPYLRSSPGNIGYGSLFEYSPEISPSEQFTHYLNGIISSAEGV